MDLQNTDAEGLCEGIEAFQAGVKNELVGECRNRADLQQLSNKITAIGAIVLDQLDSESGFTFDGDNALFRRFKKAKDDEDSVSELITRTLAALIELGMSQANWMLATQSLEWELDEED